MAKLSPLQVAAFAKAAGFKQTEIPMMVATSFGESGWDTEAIGPDGRDFGLYQIRDVHRSILPEGFFPPGTGWKDGFNNSLAARKIFESQGIKAWVAFGGTEYKKAQGQATMAAQQVAGMNDRDNLLAAAGYKTSAIGAIALALLGSSPIPGTGGLAPDFSANAGEGYPDSVGKSALDFLTSNPQAILWIAGGSVLVLLGVLLLAKNEIPLGAIGKVIGK